MIKAKIAAAYTATAITAAGAGFGGGQLLEGETIDCLAGDRACTYLSAGIIEATRKDCLDAACQALRRFQIGLLIPDLAEDIAPGEVFRIADLSKYVSERISHDDPAKTAFVNDVLNVINERLAAGYSEARFQPDETISGERFLAMLEAASL